MSASLENCDRRVMNSSGTVLSSVAVLLRLSDSLCRWVPLLPFAKPDFRFRKSRRSR